MVFKTYLDSKGERDPLDICREAVWGCTQPTVLSAEVFSWGKRRISWPFLPNTSALLIEQLESSRAQPPRCVLSALTAVSTGALEGQGGGAEVGINDQLSQKPKILVSGQRKSTEGRAHGRGRAEARGCAGEQLRALSPVLEFLSPWTLAKLASYYLNY